MPGYLNQYLAQLDPAMGVVPPMQGGLPAPPVQLPQMDITGQLPGPGAMWQPPAPPGPPTDVPAPGSSGSVGGPGTTPPAPEEAPSALAEAFPGSPIGNFAANTLNGGMQPGMPEQGQGMPQGPQVMPQQGQGMPQQGPPDLSQAGLTDQERMMYGLSAVGDIGEQLDRVVRRGKLSKWATLQGQDVAPGGLDRAGAQLRQEIMQRPGQRRQEMIQQYALQQQAEQAQQQRDALDPNSRLSQQAQQGPMGQLLRQNGFDDRTIAMVPAAHMSGVEQAVRAAAEARQAQQNFQTEQQARTAREQLQQQNWQQQFDRGGQQFQQGMEMDQRRLGLEQQRFGESTRHNRAMEGMQQQGMYAQEDQQQRAMMLRELAGQAMRSGDPAMLREVAAMDPAGQYGKALTQQAERSEQRNVDLGGARPLPSATDKDIDAAKKLEGVYQETIENLDALQKALKGYSGWDKAGDFVMGALGSPSNERTNINTRADMLQKSLNALTGQGALGDEERKAMQETFGSADKILSSFMDNPEQAATTLREIVESGRRAKLRGYQFDLPSTGASGDWGSGKQAEYDAPAAPAGGAFKVRKPGTQLEITETDPSLRQAYINAGYEVY